MSTILEQTGSNCFAYYPVISCKTRQFSEIPMLEPPWLLLQVCGFIQTTNIYIHNGFDNPLTPCLACLAIYMYVPDMHPSGDRDEHEGVGIIFVIFNAGEGTLTKEGNLLQRIFINRDT